MVQIQGIAFGDPWLDLRPRARGGALPPSPLEPPWQAKIGKGQTSVPLVDF